MDHVYGDIMKEMDFCERLCCFVIFNFYPYVSPSTVVVEMFASFCTIPCKCRDTLNLKKIFSKINELVTSHIWGCSGLILAEFILHIAQYTKMLDSIRLGPFFDGPFCFD